MYQNIHDSKLYIDGRAVEMLDTASFTDNGNNQLQSFNASFSDTHLSKMSLMNKKVEFYLNKGSFNGAPLFRGYIREHNSTDTKVSISAQDMRIFLTGDGVVPIVIDDKDNYDGYTVVQFLHDYITNKINTTETIINTNTLKEMDKPIYMTGIRGVTVPYEVISKKLKEKIDDESDTDRLNFEKIYEYFMDVIHMDDTSGITIRKSTVLDNPQYTFSFQDGIISISYKNRPPATKGIAHFGGSQVVFEYGNSPQGIKGMKVEARGDSKGEVKENMIGTVLLAQRYDKEITLEVSKGYDIGLGNIIHVTTDDKDINGSYRVTAKTISVSKAKTTCRLSCNNKPLKLSDYLN